MKKVLAVVVTYNRLELLKRCIEHIATQSFRPDILIINNSSPDGTAAYLQEQQIDHITQPNGGSSAGWHRGIEEAQKRGYDYVWLMDDDGFPDSKALELLVSEMNNETACISSVVVKENAPSEFVFGIPKLNKKGNPVLFARKRKYLSFDELPEGITSYPFALLFNGALINVSMTENIGNVNTDYFLYGDEVDYFCRLRQAGKVSTLFSAKHHHPDVTQRNIDKIRVYYFIRNTIILNKLFFDHRYTRDLFTVGIALVRILKRNGLVTFLSYVVGKNTRYVFYGIKDGYRKNMQKRY